MRERGETLGLDIGVNDYVGQLYEMLFSGTIAENIAYGSDREVSREEIEKAAKAAGIYGRDQVKWAVDMWHIHMGRDDKPAGWKDPWAGAKKSAAKPKKKKSK